MSIKVRSEKDKSWMYRQNKNTVVYTTGPESSFTSSEGGGGGDPKEYFSIASTDGQTEFTIWCHPGWTNTEPHGIVEFSFDKSTWTEWDGSNLVGTKIYFRGTGNDHMTYFYDDYIEGVLRVSHDGEQEELPVDITLAGNIETLLDYQTVMSGGHPVMAEQCYREFFTGIYSENLTITDLMLSATTLSNECYESMFANSSVSVIPSGFLPATTLAHACYYGMFQGCTRLTSLPSGLLPATILVDNCYSGMFSFVPGLNSLPDLPATTLVENCYSGMFFGLSWSLIQDANHTIPFRIPTTGNLVSVEEYALSQMFINGEPDIEVTIYCGPVSPI